MTWYSSKDVAYLLVDDQNIAGYVNTARMKTTATLVDTTGLGDTWREMSDTGLRSGEFETSGFYDGTMTIMNTVAGTNRVVGVMLEGNTVSKRIYCFQSALVSSAEVGVSTDSVHTSTPGFTVNGSVGLGYVVAPLASRSTAGNTQATYADMTAASSTCRAYLWVTSLTLGGYTSVTITPQSCDTSGGTYNDETAFAAVTAVGAQSIALASAADRYLAVKWAWNGSGTGQSVTFAVAIVP